MKIEMARSLASRCLLSLSSLVMFCGLLWYAVPAVASGRIETLKKPLTVAEFSLLDQHGEEFNLANLHGRWSMVFLGFTSCPDVCPYTLMNLEAIRADLSLRVMPEQLPQIIFLAVDPARDQPVLAQYIAHFHGDFIGISGHKSQIDRLSGSLSMAYRFQPRPGRDTYEVLHSSAVSVINPQGEVVGRLYPPFQAHAAAQQLFHWIKGVH